MGPVGLGGCRCPPPFVRRGHARDSQEPVSAFGRAGQIAPDIHIFSNREVGQVRVVPQSKQVSERRLGRLTGEDQSMRPRMAVVAALACVAIAFRADLNSAATAQSPVLTASAASCKVTKYTTLPVPALGEVFFDPYLTCVGDMFVAVATNWGGIHVQIARSSDLGSWQLERRADGTQRDLMPKLPAWSVEDSSKAGYLGTRTPSD